MYIYFLYHKTKNLFLWPRILNLLVFCVAVNLPKTEAATSLDYIRCSQCQKSFPGFAAIKAHMQTAHDTNSGSPSPTPGLGSPLGLDPPPTPGGAFACQQCNLAFALREHLEKHELVHSPNAQVVSTHYYTHTFCFLRCRNGAVRVLFFFLWCKLGFSCYFVSVAYVIKFLFLGNYQPI